jgi:hypothetical protein
MIKFSKLFGFTELNIMIRNLHNMTPIFWRKIPLAAMTKERTILGFT